MDFYWEIVERDGTVTNVPPDAVETVKRRWADNQPLNFLNKSIPSREVAKFRKTNRPYTTMPLIEAASQAFHDPLYTDNGVKARWVKKDVTDDQWARTFSQSPGYRRLSEANGITTVAFRLAIHDINPLITPYLNEDEINNLGR